MTLKTKFLFIGLTFFSGIFQQTAQGATILAGLQGGYGHGRAQITSDYKSATRHNTPQKRNSGVHGFLGGGFLGVDFNLGTAFIIGLETNGFLASLKGTDTTTLLSHPNQFNETLSQKLTSSIDLLLKLGYKFDPLTFYFKMGPSYGRWNFKSTYASESSYSKTTGLVGVKLGLGVEGDINHNLAWGVEYNHTFMKAHTFHRPFDATISTPHSIKPNYGALLVRLMYKFK